MKNTTHSSSVTRVRPSLNRCSTGTPSSAGSCTTNRVPDANPAFGLICSSSSATRACVRPAAPGTGPIPAAAAPGSAPATVARRRRRQTPNASRNAESMPRQAARRARLPTEKPQNMIITMVARRRRGLNSDVIATAFGIAPPRPSPVRNLIASSASTSVDEGRDERTDAEGERGEHDDLLAPDAVRQRPEHQRADHQPEQARGEHRAERALGQPHSFAIAGAT